MKFSHRLTLSVVLSFAPITILAQQGTSVPDAQQVASTELPDAPVPSALSDAPTSQQAPPATPAQASSSSSQDEETPRLSSAYISGTDKTKTAEQQLKEQETQRVLGVVPNFNISYRPDAVSLTAAQKFQLAFRSAIDPVTFGTALLVAGYREALDDDSGFGWGISGYARRAGAAYLDSFNGTIIGNAMLPALLHQDPRYFRRGHGTVIHRILYSAATNIMCKHDNTGKWEPNYSNVLGNIAAGALSNLYYPPSNTGIGLTITNGLVVTAEGALGSLFEEFWPDASRHFLHRDPTNGRDAEVRAEDTKEKQERQQAKEKEKARNNPTPPLRNETGAESLKDRQ